MTADGPDYDLSCSVRFCCTQCRVFYCAVGNRGDSSANNAFDWTRDNDSTSLFPTSLFFFFMNCISNEYAPSFIWTTWIWSRSVKKFTNLLQLPGAGIWTTGVPLRQTLSLYTLDPWPPLIKDWASSKLLETAVNGSALSCLYIKVSRMHYPFENVLISSVTDCFFVFYFN